MKSTADFARCFGYSHEELLESRFPKLVVPEARKFVRQQMKEKDELPHEIHGLAQDGRRFPIRFQGRNLTYHGREVRVVAVRDLTLEYRNRTFETAISGSEKLGRLVGKSAVMRRVFDLIINAASTDYGVIITGESGTGKELAAGTIHELSERKSGQFVPVNCGAISETIFEREFFGHRKGAFTGADKTRPGFLDMACGGTLFLDEVGELSPALQTKLLRVLESHEYTPLGETTPKHADIRILAATNQDVERLRREGRMRDDFFYRLRVVGIHLPPLREHKDDIPLLIEHLLKQERRKHTPMSLSPAMIGRLAQYDWPGNVRELRNVLQSYLTTGELLIPRNKQPEHEENSDLETEGLSDIVKAYEKQVILQALAQNNGNKAATAVMLNITRRGLYKKLKKYGITDV